MSDFYTVTDDTFTNTCHKKQNWDHLCSTIKKDPFARMYQTSKCSKKKYRIRCRTKYDMNTLDSVCMRGGSCHPYILDERRQEWTDSREKNIKWNLLKNDMERPDEANPAAAEYRKRYPEKYNSLLKSICDDPKSEYHLKKGCNKFFRDSPELFTNKGGQYCMQNPDMLLGKTCQNIKDGSSNQVKSAMIDKEYSVCENTPIGKFYSLDACVNAAKDKNIDDLRSATGYKWDKLWEDYCKTINKKIKDGTSTKKEEEQCSCFLSKDEIAKHKYTTDPRCLSYDCKNKGYQPYALRIQAPTQCQNVCEQNFNVESGDMSILKNIQLVQNCFNADTQSGIKQINKQVDMELGESAKVYHRSEEILKGPPPTDILNYAKSYPFLTSPSAFKEIYDELKDHFNNVARPAYETLQSMDWTSTTIPETSSKYINLQNIAREAFAPLNSLNVNYEKYLKQSEDDVHNYIEQRNIKITEGNLKIQDFLLKYPEYKGSLIGILDDMKTIKTIGEYQGDLDEIQARISAYIDSVSTTDEKLQHVKEYYNEIKALVSKLEPDDVLLRKWDEIKQLSDENLVKKFEEIQQLNNTIRAKLEPDHHPIDSKEKKGNIMYIMIAVAIVVILLVTSGASLIYLRRLRSKRRQTDLKNSDNNST